MSKSIPYTYLVKCIPTQQYYYGVKFSKKANPETFWVKYFTSSKYVQQLIKEYGKDAFEFQIRRTFNDPKKAFLWEQRVIKKLLAKKDPLCLNIALGADIINAVIAKGFVGEDGLTAFQRAGQKIKGENNPAKRKEVREKISMGAKKWVKENPIQHRINQEKSKQAMLMVDANGLTCYDRHSIYMKENCQAIGTIWINNGKNDKRHPKDEKLPVGYFKGRLANPLKDHTYEKITCPHCGLSGGGGNMKRYHFDNCKENK